MMFSRTVRSPMMPSSRRFSVEKAMRFDEAGDGEWTSAVAPLDRTVPESARSAP